jgi:hypothetical protein
MSKKLSKVKLEVLSYPRGVVEGTLLVKDKSGSTLGYMSFKPPKKEHVSTRQESRIEGDNEDDCEDEVDEGSDENDGNHEDRKPKSFYEKVAHLMGPRRKDGSRWTVTRVKNPVQVRLRVYLMHNRYAAFSIIDAGDGFILSKAKHKLVKIQRLTYDAVDDYAHKVSVQRRR